MKYLVHDFEVVVVQSLVGGCHWCHLQMSWGNNIVTVTHYKDGTEMKMAAFQYFPLQLFGFSILKSPIYMLT